MDEKKFDFKEWTAVAARIALANLTEGLADEAAGGQERAAYLASRKPVEPIGLPVEELRKLGDKEGATKHSLQDLGTDAPLEPHHAGGAPVTRTGTLDRQAQIDLERRAEQAVEHDGVRLARFGDSGATGFSFDGDEPALARDAAVAASVWQLPRNDIPAALAFVRQRRPPPDAMAVILELQDDPTDLIAELTHLAAMRGSEVPS